MGKKRANQAEIKDAFSFLNKNTYDKLTRGLHESGSPIPGPPKILAEKPAEVKLLAKGEPIPLDSLVRSNLVKQELTRLGITSIALLNKTMSVAQNFMRKLRVLLERRLKTES